MGNVCVTDPVINSPYFPSIDENMRALSISRGENSRAIVFSGMGDDGTTGSEAIIVNGGEVFVQSPDECEAVGMPTSILKSFSNISSLSISQLAQTIISKFR